MTLPKRLNASTVSLYLILSAGCDAAHVYRYATLEDARKDPVIIEGWLPPFLPESSTALVVSSNLETNETWGSFRFSQDDAGQSRRVLTPINIAGHNVRHGSSLRDWPPFLRGQLTSEALTKAGYEPFGVKTDRPFFVVINWREGNAYFWRYCCRNPY